MDDTTHVIEKPAVIEISPRLDRARYREEFQHNGHVHLDNFLNAAGALALFQYLERDVQWRTFVVARERLLGTPAGSSYESSPEDDREICDTAVAAANDGFACVFDADHLFAEDEAGVAGGEGHPVESRLGEFGRFFSSETLLEFVRSLTGRMPIIRGDARAMRLRRGHFVSFHEATRSADRSGRRLATALLNLTPEWKIEWGGLLSFRSRRQCGVEAYCPCFNSLDLYAFPHGNWLTQVAPYALGPRLSISLRFYA
jgi:SM-20-related protein